MRKAQQYAKRTKICMGKTCKLNQPQRPYFLVLKLDALFDLGLKSNYYDLDTYLRRCVVRI